jgi:hypothetical protein
LPQPPVWCVQRKKYPEPEAAPDCRLRDCQDVSEHQAFHDMTALENVMVGRHLRSRAGFLASMLNMPWTLKERTADPREIDGAA